MFKTIIAFALGFLSAIFMVTGAMGSGVASYVMAALCFLVALFVNQIIHTTKKNEYYNKLKGTEFNIWK